MIFLSEPGRQEDHKYLTNLFYYSYSYNKFIIHSQIYIDNYAHTNIYHLTFRRQI